MLEKDYQIRALLDRALGPAPNNSICLALETELSHPAAGHATSQRLRAQDQAWLQVAAITGCTGMQVPEGKYEQRESMRRYKFGNEG